MNSSQKYFSMNCPVTSCFIDVKNIMKAANKPALADAMWALMPQDAPGPSKDDCVYVINGGSLLH